MSTRRIVPAVTRPRHTRPTLPRATVQYDYASRRFVLFQRGVGPIGTFETRQQAQDAANGHR